MLPGCFLVAGWSKFGDFCQSFGYSGPELEICLVFVFFVSCFTIVKWRFARAADRLRVQPDGDGGR